MNWTRSSRLAVGLLALALLVAAGAFGATAVEFEGDSPESAEVGTEVDVELTMTEPFDVGDEWTMQVTTGLESPRLVVTARDGAGNPVKEVDVTSTGTQMEINDTSISSVDIEVTGEVPEIANDGPGEYSYENPVEESIFLLKVAENLGDQTETVDNGSFVLQRFTQDSRDARQAIDDASDAAEEADSDDARDRIDEAITFYNSGEFESAIDAANEAENTAEGGGDGNRTLLIVGGVLVLVVAVGGVAYFLRSRQEPENKLQ
jgi:hypothetical protein